MIKAEQIYQATNDGLDIIFALYPDAKNCFAKYCTKVSQVNKYQLACL